VARCTFGLLRERYGHPQVRAFYDMAPATGQAAREWDGMISFLRRDITVDPDPDRDDAAKRPYLYPRAMPDTAHHPQQAWTTSTSTAPPRTPSPSGCRSRRWGNRPRCSPPFPRDRSRLRPLHTMDYGWPMAGFTGLFST